MEQPASRTPRSPVNRDLMRSSSGFHPKQPLTMQPRLAFRASEKPQRFYDLFNGFLFRFKVRIVHDSFLGQADKACLDAVAVERDFVHPPGRQTRLTLPAIAILANGMV